MLFQLGHIVGHKAARLSESQNCLSQTVVSYFSFNFVFEVLMVFYGCLNCLIFFSI